jgi:hypothetical protein
MFKSTPKLPANVLFASVAWLFCSAGCSGSGDTSAHTLASAGHAAEGGGSGSFLIPVSDAGIAPDKSVGPCDSTFTAIARLVFVGARCTTSNCHAPGPDAPAAALDLTEASAYRHLVDVKPWAQLDSSWRRVTIGDEQTSLLYRKLVAAEPAGEELPGNAGAPMPIGLPAVAPEHLSAIRMWIRGGAPETGVTSGTEDFVAQCAAR